MKTTIYPYFTIKNENPYTFYKCINTCWVLLPSLSLIMKAKLCFGDDWPSTGEYTFYVKVNENQKYVIMN